MRVNSGLFRALIAITVGLAAGAVHADEPATKYYDVIGSTAEELRRELNLKGVLYDIGKRAAGYTRWDVSWRYRYEPTSTGCMFTDFQSELKSTITLPRWVAGRHIATEATIADWNQFITALRLHEEGHYAHGVRAARDIHTLGQRFQVSEDCSMIARRFNLKANAIIKRYMQEDAEYDKRTELGRTQGAYFPR